MQKKRDSLLRPNKKGTSEEVPFEMVGQQFLMGCRFLERRVVTRNSLFIRQLTGKKQAFENFILWILRTCWNAIPLQRNIRQKHFKFPTQSNREDIGKC